MYKSILKFIKKPAVKITVSLLIIAALFIWLPVDELWKTLQKISIQSWLIVFAGFLAAHLLGTVKWRLLINISEKKLPFLVAVRCYFAGLFSNLFLPSLAGGDIVKTGLAIQYNKEKGTTIFGTVLDRVIDTGSVVFIIIVAAFLSPKFLQLQDQNIVFIIAGAFMVLILFAALLLAIPVEKISHRKIKNVMNRARQILKLTYQNPGRPITAFLLSLCIQTTFILLTVYLAIIIDIEIPLVLWFLVWPLAKLSALLPISLGGIGVREVALAALLSRVSIPFVDSVVLGLLWESVLICSGLFGGILYLVLKYVSHQDIPSLASISKRNDQIMNYPEDE